MRFRALSSLLLTLALLATAYAVWLLVTDDYDGGRRPFGAMIIAVMAVVFLLGHLLRREARLRSVREPPQTGKSR